MNCSNAGICFSMDLRVSLRQSGKNKKGKVLDKRETRKQWGGRSSRFGSGEQTNGLKVSDGSLFFLLPDTNFPIFFLSLPLSSFIFSFPIPPSLFPLLTPITQFFPLSSPSLRSQFLTFLIFQPSAEFINLRRCLQEAHSPQLHPNQSRIRKIGLEIIP